VGQRPWKIQKIMPDQSNKMQMEQQKSVLNERRLKEHEMNMARDPNFKKNQKRFFAIPSNHTVQRSSSSITGAQKFDQYIAK